MLYCSYLQSRRVTYKEEQPCAFVLLVNCLPFSDDVLPSIYHRPRNALPWMFPVLFCFNTMKLKIEGQVSHFLRGFFLFLKSSKTFLFLFYLTALSVVYITSNDAVTSTYWIGKDAKGGVRGLIWSNIPALLCKDWGKPLNTSVRIAGIQPRFELETSQVRSMSVTHSPATSVF
jgi:hypothetical protein